MWHKNFLILLLVYAVNFAQSSTINLVSNNKTDYKIVLSSFASPWDSLAAAELQKYIEEISGARITIVDDSSPVHSNEIIIGKNKHSQHINTSGINDDGFIIKTEKNKLHLLGINGKGSLNSVYTLLEKYLNCRMYSSSAKVIPKQSSILLPPIDLLENPVFTYRDVHYYESTYDGYCRWHKLVDSEDKNIWGMFVHTFQDLLPSEKYFEKYPEYFALRGEIRVPDQPCLNNPEVFKIIVDQLRKRINRNPLAQIWSVSQNDNYSCCQCPGCSKIDEHEGSPSGSVINFVNKVAKEFPDKIISTLAYQYSRKAPKHIKPKKNVNIMLCTIECYRTKPIYSDTSSSGFLNDLIEWSKLTNNIFLWDYVVQFTNLISPFPNFQVLQPNIQLFAKYNTKMMFQQGAGRRQASEFGELRSYLIAKLLWNPYINIDSVMNDFLSGYYGNAGKFIKLYIDFMQSELLKSDAQLNIYGDPIESMNNYLSPELIDKYNTIFNDAESSVSCEPEFLNRVKTARLPLTYAMLEHAKVIEDKNKGLVIKQDGQDYIPNPKLISLLNDLSTYTKNIDDVYLNEKGLTPGNYIARYKTMLSKTMKNPLGLFKPAQYITEPNYKYPANGVKTLTDGKRGDEDHHYNWLGFEGNNMEVVIDLEKISTVKKVSADFLQISFSWIFLPEQFEVSLSNNGENFTAVSSIKNTTPVTKEETVSPAYAFIKNFSCKFDSVKARYIKVKAVNMGTCPRWHPGYPFKAWIFTDEIVVE